MINLAVVLTSLLALQSSPLPVEKPPKMTLTYIEYNRGYTFPTRAQIGIHYPGQFDLTFHKVRMIGNAFYPDDSIIPNAFLKPLFKGNFSAALNAFTEPYYTLRVFHFFKQRPNLGIGVEFIHFKIFIPDEGEQVLVTGQDQNGPVDSWKSTKDYIDSYNVSHGINLLSLSLVYRMMLMPTEKILAGRIQPYAALSIGPCIPHPQLRLAKDPEYKAFGHQFRFDNFGYGFSLGSRFQVLKNFGLYLEYKFTQIQLNEMLFDNGEEGTFWTRCHVHHLLWGLSIIF